MKKQKYCETLKTGYYLYDNPLIDMKRCTYLTGELKGNKWIELNLPNPKWMTLMWFSVDKYQIDRSTYHETNPTNILIT
jgi:hypothetical protein